MSKSKEGILSDLLKDIRPDKLCDKMYLTGFLGIEGEDYAKDRELMVIGRAVNGWTEYGWLPKDSAAKAEEIVNQIIKESPILWTKLCHNGYMKKAPFWNVIKKIAKGLKIADDENNCPSKLFWSNLYKISPYCGGNPDDSLINLQCNACKDLLKKEIDDAKPNRILMLTGLDYWAQPFLDDLQISEHLQKGDGKYVERKGRWNNCKVVVAKHPQGKVQQEYVKEVVAAFEKLNRSESHK